MGEVEKSEGRGFEIAIAATVLFLASRLAFTFRARREMGERDDWTCQETGKQFKDGWMMQAAHYPDEHQSAPDEDISKGRMLSTEAHILEELRRGNMNGARGLWGDQTIRTYAWMKENDCIDEKKPFSYYVNLSNSIEP